VGTHSPNYFWDFYLTNNSLVFIGPLRSVIFVAFHQNDGGRTKNRPLYGDRSARNSDRRPYGESPKGLHEHAFQVIITLCRGFIAPLFVSLSPFLYSALLDTPLIFSRHRQKSLQSMEAKLQETIKQVEGADSLLMETGQWRTREQG
jgi:hypothetical protein